MGKVSFSSLSTWSPAHQDLYEVSFPSDKKLNAMPSQPGAGVFPATSVDEPIFDVEYEDVRLVSGLILPFPIDVNLFSAVSVTFSEAAKYEVSSYLLDWAQKAFDNSTYLVNSSPEAWAKDMVVVRKDVYGNAVKTSKYQVLLPDSLRLANSNQNTVVEGSLTFRVIKVYDKLK